MPPKKFTWITQTPEQAAMGQKGSRIFDNARRQNHAQLDTIARARRIGSKSILTPPGIVPLKNAMKSLALPTKFGSMMQPDSLQPPIFLPSGHAMDNFGAFLEAVGWCGLEYGAVHLRLPKKEEDGAWWKRTKDGRINIAPAYRFEVRVQDLVPRGVDGSKAFELQWHCMKKLDMRTSFADWAAALEDQDGWEQEDPKALWDKELKGKGKQGKLCGVDAPAALCNRQESPLNVFNQEFNVLHHTSTQYNGIQSAYIYGGTPGTVFTWHVKDYHLYSANYQIDGADKVWYLIPPYYIHNFFHKQTQLLAFEDSEEMSLSCPQFLSHQFCINSEQGLPLTRDEWKHEGYKCFKYTQQKQDMIITWPGVYHSGINTGWNLSEAVNFGTKNWLEEARSYQPCTCLGKDTAIFIDLDEIQAGL